MADNVLEFFSKYMCLYLVLYLCGSNSNIDNKKDSKILKEKKKKKNKKKTTIKELVYGNLLGTLD